MKIPIDYLDQKCLGKTPCKTGSFLYSIIDKLPDAIFVTDISGDFIYTGPGVSTLFGYSEAEIVSVGNIFKLIGSKFFDLASLNEENQTELSECKILDSNKNALTIKILLTKMDTENSEILIICQDITERKKAEQELQRYECIVSSSKDMIALLDKDFVYLAANDNYLQPFGLTRNKLIGSTVAEIFGKTHFEKVIQPHAKECFQGNRVSYFGTFKFHNQEKRSMEITYDPFLGPDNKIIGFMVNGRDITRRKLAEEKLQESEKKYKSLFTNMQNGFALHEMVFNKTGKPIDYIFLDVNKAFEEQTSLKSEDIIGRKVTEVLPGIENDPANWIDTYGKVVLTGKSISFENYSEPLGKWYSVLAYRPNDGQFATVCSDITERRQTEQQLKDTHADLIGEQIKLRAKNTALNEVLKQIDNGKRLLKSQIQTNTNRVIMPLLDILKEKVSKDQSEYVEMLAQSLNEITSPFVNMLEEQFSNLSPREMEICRLIKKGHTSKEIAHTLCISPQTVFKQRKNIRKKFNLNNKKTNLVSFLNARQFKNN